MPTEEENIQYLYLVLTNGGPPQIDWPAICTELNLNHGAASKRWSRLKQALEAGNSAGAQAYQTLWTVFKHSKREGAPDWKLIAQKCNTTPGAASKRYSRMKLAFEKEANDAAKKAGGGGGAAAGSSTSAPGTPSGSLPATPKRKRGAAVPGSSSAKKNKATPKKLADGDGVFKPEPVSDEDEETPRKRGRGAGKGKKVVKTEPVDEDGVAAPAVDAAFLAAPPAFRGFEGEGVPFRGFDVGEEEDTFFDAREEVGDVGGGGMDEEQLDFVSQWLDDGFI